MKVILGTDLDGFELKNKVKTHFASARFYEIKTLMSKKGLLIL